MRSEEGIHEELCCRESRKHVFQRRTGNIICSRTAAHAKNKTENIKRNGDGKRHKGWEKNTARKKSSKRGRWDHAFVELCVEC